MDIISTDLRNQIVINGTIDKNENKAINLKEMKIELKEHQRMMVSKMINLESNSIKIKDNIKLNTSVGVCADIAGAGKSLCVLSLITNNKNLKPKEKVSLHFGNLVHISKKYEENTCISSNLIVVPHS